MATYAIGDIHGSLKALETLFEVSDFQEDDVIVFLGDYVDKGPDTKGVIEFLINLKVATRVYLMGNHEIMMLAARENRYSIVDWMRYGGSNTLDSYNIYDDPNWGSQIPASHWEFLSSCQSYYQSKDRIFVHAGLTPGIPLVQQNNDDLFWKKYETPSAFATDRVVICGHTVRISGEIADFHHTICIDTYAHGGMWLTCFNTSSGEYLQTNNNRESKLGSITMNFY